MVLPWGSAPAGSPYGPPAWAPIYSRETQAPALTSQAEMQTSLARSRLGITMTRRLLEPQLVH